MEILNHKEQSGFFSNEPDRHEVLRINVIDTPGKTKKNVL